MSEHTSSPDWRDPFAPEGTEVGETFDPLKQSPRRSIVPQLVVLCLIVGAVAAVAYYYLKPPKVSADRTVVVGLPKTVAAVAQIDVPATLEGIDTVLEIDASSLLGKMCEQGLQGFGVKLPLDQVEYLIVALNQPTGGLFGAPSAQGMDSMLFYLRFKSPQVAAALLPADTPSTDRSDGTRVFEFQGMKLVLVDDRTWLMCPENLLLTAQYAYREQSQPEWLEEIDSDEPLFFAGRMSGLSPDDPSARYEMLVTARLADPCTISGRCTTPRYDQAQELLNHLQQSLDADYEGLGPIGTELFDKADLALNERTVNFEGEISAEEVRIAMEPITRMWSVFAFVGAPDTPREAEVPDDPLPAHIADTPINRRCWELLETAKANIPTRNRETGEFHSPPHADSRIAHECLDELLSIPDAHHEFVAESHMLLCGGQFDEQWEHFRALQEMENVPSPILIEACRSMLESEFEEDSVTEICTYALQLDELPEDCEAEFLVRRAGVRRRSIQDAESFNELIPLVRADVDRTLTLPGATNETRAEAYELRAGTQDNMQSRIDDYTLGLELPGISAERQFMLFGLRAQARNHAEDYAGALVDYTARCEIEGLPEDQQAMALDALASFHFSRQEYEPALAVYDAIVDGVAMPDYAREFAQLDRGRVHHALGNLDAAIDDFSERISDRRFTSRWNAYLQRGKVYEDQERFEEALDDYSEAVETVGGAVITSGEDPLEPLLCRARLRQTQGDEAGALEDYQALQESFDDLADEVAEEVSTAIEQLSDSPAPAEAN